MTHIKKDNTQKTSRVCLYSCPDYHENHVISLELVRVAIHFNLTTITCTLSAAYVFAFLENRTINRSTRKNKFASAVNTRQPSEEETNKFSAHLFIIIFFT